jgi:hypothetical protein
VDVALHERSSVIVLDEPHPSESTT